MVVQHRRKSVERWEPGKGPTWQSVGTKRSGDMQLGNLRKCSLPSKQTKNRGINKIPEDSRAISDYFYKFSRKKIFIFEKNT